MTYNYLKIGLYFAYIASVSADVGPLGSVTDGSPQASMPRESASPQSPYIRVVLASYANE